MVINPLTLSNPVSFLNNLDFSNVIQNLFLEISRGENIPLNTLYIVSLGFIFFRSGYYVTKKYTQYIERNAAGKDLKPSDETKNPDEPEESKSKKLI